MHRPDASFFCAHTELGVPLTAAQIQANIDAIAATLLRLYQRADQQITIRARTRINAEITTLEKSLEKWEAALAALTNADAARVLTWSPPG